MSLKQKIVSGMRWSLSLRLLTQVVTWAITLIVIRLLQPADYGLMAISQVVFNIMLGLSTMGLGDALVQRDLPERDVLARVYGLILAIGLALALATVLLAYPIADWYHDERLVALVQVSALGYVLNALTAIPRALLSRTLRIRELSIAEMASTLAASAFLLALALSGGGVWALMVGWLAAAALRCAGLIWLTRTQLPWPRLGLDGVRPLFSFGFYRALESLAWIASISLDALVIGRTLGPVALGLYSMAMNFAMMPINKIAPTINGVAFPAFAMVKTRPDEARYYLIKSLRLMATWCVPIFFGLAAVAPEIVSVIFGPQWADATWPLVLLALASAFRAIPLPIPNYLQGLGDARASFWCSAVDAVLVVPAILVGCRWGVDGAAAAWLVIAPVHYVACILIAAWRGAIPARQLLAPLVRPLVAGLAMLAVLAAVRHATEMWTLDVGRLAVLVAVGAVTYGSLAILLMPDLLRELRSLWAARA